MQERQREIADSANRTRLTIDVDNKLKRLFREALIRQDTTAVKVIDGFIRQYVKETLGEAALEDV